MMARNKKRKTSKKAKTRMPKKAVAKKKPKADKGKKGVDAILIVGVILIVAIGVYLMFSQRETIAESEPQTTTIPAKEKSVRKPGVAGSFFPADEKKLDEMIDGFLDDAEKQNLYGVLALVSPHAGYVYSGKTAARGFKQLTDSTIKTVVVIAPSHRAAFKGASIADVTHYKTPLGEIALSDKVNQLRTQKVFVSNPNAHSKEHSLEVQLPFLQKVLGDFKLVPIVTGSVDPAEIAEAIKPILDDNTLIIASTDLSHYHDYDTAVRMDAKTVDAIASLDFNTMRLSGCEACGKTPTLVLMHLANDLNWRSRVLDYTNSGDTAGDKQRVVGYASIAFYTGLNESEQDYLTSLARETVEAVVSKNNPPEVDENTLPPKLKEISGCFVTLNKHGGLRGCIGHIMPQEPLYKCVIENAVSAALYDRRFSPVEEDELKEIHLGVSVLSPPKKLVHSGGNDLVEKLVPHIDGIVLRQGRRQSTYLPQVWDQLPTHEIFLSSLCKKGGMRGDCYRDKKTEVQTYRAQVFEEK